MAKVATFRVLVLGGFHFGESDKTDGPAILDKYGYSHSTTHLRRFAETCDSTILNLDTPLVMPDAPLSPLRGKKRYLRWGHPVETTHALQKLGVNAVSLANNHSVDHGIQGLESTIQTLSEAGIHAFGVGRDLHEARQPFRLPLPDTVGGGEIHFHGSLQYRQAYDADFGFYASAESAGCAPLKVSDVPNAKSASTRPDSLQVAFPNWGPNYAWRSTTQYRVAHRFLNKGYDLVLGHGGHSIQETHRKQQRWVVYSLGKGMINSPGRWRRSEEENGILPYSFWAILEVHREDTGRRWLTLKLYPVYANNRETNYQPQAVSAEDFQRLLKTLESRASRPWRFDNPANTRGMDDLGHYLELDLGEWPAGLAPTRLEPATGSGDPGDWPLRSPGTEIEDRVLGLDKHLGASMQVIGAEAEGGTASWLTNSMAIIDIGEKRMLTQGYWAHETVLGGAIVSDKVLTAQLLKDNGVATPTTLVVSSADAAVEASKIISGPIVIKPRSGNKSKGVSVGLVKEQEVREAFAFARKHGSEIIVQQHIEGTDELRVMASANDIVAVNGRVLPHIIGDGISTVSQLIEDKNLQRTLNPSLFDRPIPIDNLTLRQLERLGLSLESVPELGRSITVRDVAGLSVGGDTHQLLELSDHTTRTAAMAAIAAIPGLQWGGVDLIIEKGTGNPYIIEINTGAAYGAALFPAYGTPRDVATKVWQLRRDATEPEVTGSPVVPTTRRTDLPIIPSACTTSETQLVNFSHLFEDSLIRRGYGVATKSARVIEVTSPQNQTSLVTKRGLTAADKSVVRRVLRFHRWVRLILNHNNVPQPRGTQVTSAEELREFVQGGMARVTLTPIGTHWGGQGTQNLDMNEALSLTSLPRTSWVQARPEGLRLRILATRHSCCVVIANREQPRLNGDELASVGKLAVEATRAVPELRWAAVDILLPSKRTNSTRQPHPLVEGLSVEPVFTSEDKVVHGNFDDFCEDLISVAWR